MLNKVLLCGRVTADPKLVGSEGKVCSLSIAVQRDMADKNGEYATDFINLTAFSNVANYIMSHVAKGNLVNVSGRLVIESYKAKDNTIKQATKVNVENLYLLEKSTKKPTQSQAQESEHDYSSYNEVVDEDDLPF